MSEVQYREITNFPGYRVGDDGSVWTCRARKSLGVGKGSRFYMSDLWTEMTPVPNVRSGYLYIMLYQGGKKRLRVVHRLVLEAFVGPCPEGMEACHDPDRNKANCRLDNLRWGTRLSNAADRIKHGTTGRGDKHYSRTKPESVCRGEAHHSSKANSELVKLIRLQARQGVPRKQMQEASGLSEASVRRIILRESWKHVCD